MRRLALHRRFVAWIAFFAILVGALGPAMAHVAGVSKATKWIEICSNGALVQIEVPADGPGLPHAPKASDFDHCPFCAPHDAPAMAMSLPVAAFDAPVAVGLALPSLTPSAPHAFFGRSTVRSRAPPFLS